MNKIFLIGRLTNDPEVKVTGNTQYAKFTLAVDKRFKKEGEATADFFNCVAFGKRADVINQFFFKGSKIAVSGEMQSSKYTDKDGNKRTSWEVTIEEFDFCESKRAPEPEQKTDEDGFMEVPDGFDDLPFQ